MEPGLRVVSTRATAFTPLNEPKTSMFLAEKARNPVYRLLVSKVEALDSNYSKICFIFKMVKDYQNCACNKANKEQTRYLKLFSSSASLESIAIEIFGFLLKMITINQFVVVMTDRYHTLTRAVQASKTSEIWFPSILYNHWIVAIEYQPNC